MTLLNVLAMIGGIAFGLFIIGEMAAAVYIYRNRTTIIPRLRNLFAGKDYSADLARIERKVNYIGRHVKFEREQLRNMGILRDAPTPEREVTQQTPNGVINFPSRRN